MGEMCRGSLSFMRTPAPSRGTRCPEPRPRTRGSRPGGRPARSRAATGASRVILRLRDATRQPLVPRGGGAPMRVGLRDPAIEDGAAGRNAPAGTGRGGRSGRRKHARGAPPPDRMPAWCSPAARTPAAEGAPLRDTAVTVPAAADEGAIPSLVRSSGACVPIKARRERGFRRRAGSVRAGRTASARDGTCATLREGSRPTMRTGEAPR